MRCLGVEKMRIPPGGLPSGFRVRSVVGNCDIDPHACLRHRAISRQEIGP